MSVIGRILSLPCVMSLSVFLLVLLQGNSGALEPVIRPFEMPSSRMAALGGEHAALVDDFNGVFFNPAGFAGARPMFEVLELSTEIINTDFYSQLLIDAYNDNVDFNADLLKKLINNHLNADLGVGGPLSFGKISDGWGWRFFNVSRASAVWNPDEMFQINITLSEEFVFNAGWGFRLVDTEKSTLDSGFNLKSFYRMAHIPDRVFIQEILHILQEMKDKPYETQAGVGFDLGLLYTWNNSVSLGLVWKDPYSPAYVTRFQNLKRFFDNYAYIKTFQRVKPRLAAGLTIRPFSPERHRHNTDLVFSFDYNGLMDINSDNRRNQLLDLSAGIEFRFLEVISLRAGWSEWQPNFGIGFDFSFMKLDLSYSMYELGKELNEDVVWGINLGLLFVY